MREVMADNAYLKNPVRPTFRPRVESCEVFAMFLLGLYVGRRRIFHDIPKHMQLIRRVFWWGLPIGLVSMGAERILNATTGYEVFGEQQATLLPQLFGDVLFVYGSTLLALGYAAGITLLAQHHRGRQLLYPLGAAGRMALTVYLSGSHHVRHAVLRLCFWQRLLAGTGSGYGICRFIFCDSDRVFCLVDKPIPLWADGVVMARSYVPEVPVYEAPRAITLKGLRPGMAACGRFQPYVTLKFTPIVWSLCGQDRNLYPRMGL